MAHKKAASGLAPSTLAPPERMRSLWSRRAFRGVLRMRDHGVQAKGIRGRLRPAVRLRGDQNPGGAGLDGSPPICISGGKGACEHVSRAIRNRRSSSVAVSRGPTPGTPCLWRLSPPEPRQSHSRNYSRAPQYYQCQLLSKTLQVLTESPPMKHSSGKFFVLVVFVFSPRQGFSV